MNKEQTIKEFKIVPSDKGSFAGIPLMEFTKEELIGLLDWQYQFNLKDTQ